MHVPFDPDCDDHWVIRPDLGFLWYDRACFDLDPFVDDILRDDKWTNMDNNYSKIASKWELAMTYWPQDKRRARGITGLSQSIRPSLDVDRWRSQVDEDCFLITQIPFI